MRRELTRRPMRRTAMPTKRRTATRTSLKLRRKAEEVVNAVEEEVEKILKDTEDACKECTPASKHRITLRKVAKQLAKEGVSCKFAMPMGKRRTAEEEATVTVEEVQEVADNIVETVVEELESLLEETDEALDTIVDEEIAEATEEDAEEIEASFKGDVARRLAAKGIRCRFAMKHAKRAPETSKRARVASRTRKSVNKIAAKVKAKMHK